MTKKDLDNFILQGLETGNENEIETFKSVIKDFDIRTRFSLLAVIEDELDTWMDLHDSRYHRLKSLCHKLTALDYVDNDYDARETMKGYLSEYLRTIIDDYGETVKPFTYADVENFTAEKLYLSYILLNEDLKNKILKH